jgi:probable rRNA maturation factor
VTPPRERTRVVYRPPWRVDVVTRADIEPPLAASAIADAIGRALDATGAPSPGSVTVVLTDDSELAELNAEHMGVDGPTDVLSFPMLPPEAFPRDGRHARSASQAKRGAGVQVGGRRIHFGDIAISVERAIAQAEQGRGGQTGDVHWSAADEVRLLVTHGALHLCGWDHAEVAEESAMRGLETSILRTIDR